MQEGVTDPPSVSSINRLLRGSDRRDDDGRKDYSIHGILGGKFLFIFSILFLDVIFSAKIRMFSSYSKLRKLVELNES